MQDDDKKKNARSGESEKMPNDWREQNRRALTTENIRTASPIDQVSTADATTKRHTRHTSFTPSGMRRTAPDRHSTLMVTGSVGSMRPVSISRWMRERDTGARIRSNLEGARVGRAEGERGEESDKGTAPRRKRAQRRSDRGVRQRKKSRVCIACAATGARHTTAAMPHKAAAHQPPHVHRLLARPMRVLSRRPRLVHGTPPRGLPRTPGPTIQSSFPTYSPHATTPPIPLPPPPDSMLYPQTHRS